MIEFLKDKYLFLDNFYNCEVTYEGLTYRNSEAAFQASKTLNKEDRKRFCSMSPSQAKFQGSQVDLRPDWEEVKYQVMYDIVYAKFTQNKDLKRKLLQTEDEFIIEKNYHHDNIWGDCQCDRCIDKKGTNWLGEILMKVREGLRNETN